MSIESTTLTASYRPLSDFEIMTLEVAGCTAEDWSRVLVAEDFNPRAIAHVDFSGDIRLGTFHETVRLMGGVERPTGIRHASLHNCTIGNEVYIRHVGRHIANYDIADRVVIEDVSLLAVEGETTFGNGIEAEVLNEAGGRSVPVFDRLSSQMAYLLAMHRDRRDLQKQLRRAIAAYVDSVRSKRGYVGTGARLTGCGALINVRIGPAAVLQGVLKLVDVSLNSNPHAPVVLGEGVAAEKVVVASGACLDHSALLTKCFVGQGVRIGRQFSADNSLFFANCEAQHGEACSLMAGPYTVTHHKSTLLIAGLFSFYNAGSGTNQSNHLYKLGPLHQGVLERGAKTGSSSYLVWCSRVAPFTTVIGRHTRPVDVSDFPFSYLLDAAGQSLLVPAAGLANVGTLRDIHKWRDRDRRTDPDLLDRINFEAFSPYTVGRMQRAAEMLSRMGENEWGHREYVSVGGVQIRTSRLHRAAGLYRTAVQMYLGGKIAAKLEAYLGSRGNEVCSLAELQQLLKSDGQGQGEWVDMAGLLAPRSQVAQLLDDIESGEIASLTALETRLLDLHAAYERLEWDWVAGAWLALLGRKAEEVTLDDFRQAIRTWKNATSQYNQGVLRDAEQEFKESAQVSYGIDGDREIQLADFVAVRGEFNDNAFVRKVQDQTREVAERADSLLARLQGASPAAA